MQWFHARTGYPSSHAPFPRIALNSPVTGFVTFCVNLLRPWSAEDDALARHQCHSWGDASERQINHDIIAPRHRRS